MKMAENHVNSLKAEIASITIEDALRVKEAIYSSNMPRDFNKRLAWDIFYYAVPSSRRTSFFDTWYEYLNDDHITTALKKVVFDLFPELKN